MYFFPWLILIQQLLVISVSPSNKSLNVESDFVNPLNLKLVSEMKVILVGIAASNFSVGLNCLGRGVPSPFSSPSRMKCTESLLLVCGVHREDCAASPPSVWVHREDCAASPPSVWGAQGGLCCIESLLLVCGCTGRIV